MCGLASPPAQNRAKATPTNTYTDTQRTQVLAFLEQNGGNVMAAVRETGFPRITIRGWWREHQAVNAGVVMAAGENKTHDTQHFIDRWAQVQDLSTARLLELLPEAGAKELQTIANTAGISADKFMDYTQGRKGTAVNIHNDNREHSIVMSPEELRVALAEVRAQREQG